MLVDTKCKRFHRIKCVVLLCVLFFRISLSRIYKAFILIELLQSRAFSFCFFCFFFFLQNLTNNPQFLTLQFINIYMILDFLSSLIRVFFLFSWLVFKYFFLYFIFNSFQFILPTFNKYSYVLENCTRHTHIHTHILTYKSALLIHVYTHTHHLNAQNVCGFFFLLCFC